MGPRRELTDEAASRQLIESNNTLNRFLGGSSRRLSWLYGGSAPINPRPQNSPPRNHARTVSGTATTTPTTRPSSERRHTSSTSNSPNLPNNAPAVQARPIVTSISPPQTPATRQSPAPISITEIPPPTSDESRKRKQMALHSQAAPSKRFSSGNGNGMVNRAPIAPSPDTSGQAEMMPQQNPQSRWQPTQIPATSAMAPPGTTSAVAGPDDARRMSGTHPNWQQAYGTSLAQQFVQNGASPVQIAQNGTSPTQIQSPMQVLPSNVPTGNAHIPKHIRTVSAPYSAGQSPTMPSPTVPSPTAPNSAWGQSPNFGVQQGGFRGAEDGFALQNAAGNRAAATRILQQRQESQQNVVPAQHIVVPSSPQPSIPSSLPVIHPYSREICEDKVVQFKEQHGQTNGPMSAVEHARTDLLLKAAKDGDSLFMFIHQVVSQSAVDFDNLPSILRNANGFSDAITMLSHLMAGEYLNNKYLLNFFATLPWPLTYLAMERPDNYQLLVNHVAHMSFALQHGWMTLKQQCLQRGYPPLSIELWVLNIYSPTLMDVFFLAVIRQLWANDQPNYVNGTHEIAKQIFEETKSALYSCLNGWSATPAILENIGAAFHPKYSMFAQQVAARANQTMQQGQPVLISPLVGVVPPNPRRPSGQAAVPMSPSTAVNGYHSPQMPPMQPPPGQFRPPSRPQNYTRPTQSTTPVQPVLPKSALFLPSAGAPRPNQAATATWQMTALHQAHLRDPVFDLPETPQGDLLYQNVVGFAVAPRRLNRHELYQNYSFTLPSNVRIAQTMDPQDGQRKVRQIDADTLQYRLRIVKVGTPTNGGQEDLESDWIRKATSWPQNMYYSLNDHSLEVRRKQHHTKDLPVDLTEYIKAGGISNILEVYANLSFEEAESTLGMYAFAIEIVAATTYKAILETSLQSTISSADSRHAIMQSLQPRTTSGDDEVIMDAARTNIQIYDPISQSAICAIPARGIDCKHRECFDLPTFLQTRPRERPHWPTEVDVWKCPICLQDVRPHKIVVDGFLKEVREELVAQGKEKTRVIIVEADGSWAAKVEEDVGSERSTPDVDGARAEGKPVVHGDVVVGSRPPVAGQSLKKRQMVVIDLCEDD